MGLSSQRRVLRWRDEVALFVVVSAPTAARLDALSQLTGSGPSAIVSEAISWFCVRRETQLARTDRLKLEAKFRQMMEGADVETIRKLRDLQAFLW